MIRTSQSGAVNDIMDFKISAATMKAVLSQIESVKSLRKPKAIEIPHRKPSKTKPLRKKTYITPDKLQCKTCTCYPKEEPYSRFKKVRPCLYTPLTLYELCSKILDYMPAPQAFYWETTDVMNWMVYSLRLPQYEECIWVNKIDGRRLIMLEDPSKLPMMNITDFKHIMKITTAVKKLYGMDMIRAKRSISLPIRRPMVHVNAFKARTGPNWGIRQNRTYSDILRWMKILGPEPVKIDHWDLVWYEQPDCPKTLFGRVPPRDLRFLEKIPICTEKEEIDENLVPRKYRLNAEPSVQLIWMEKYPTTQEVIDHFLADKRKPIEYPIRDTLLPKPMDLTGLSGKYYVLAKRKNPRAKFFPDFYVAKRK